MGHIFSKEQVTDIDMIEYNEDECVDGGIRRGLVLGEANSSQNLFEEVKEG